MCIGGYVDERSGVGGSITRMNLVISKVGVLYGELHGRRSRIVVAPRGLCAILAAHIAAPVEALFWDRGAKFSIAPQFSTPGGDALRG